MKDDLDVLADIASAWSNMAAEMSREISSQPELHRYRTKKLADLVSRLEWLERDAREWLTRTTAPRRCTK